jgi:toxin ParE1/3/4
MNKTKISISKRAEIDIEETTVYLALDNPGAEESFRKALETTFTLLAAMPEMGATRDFRSPRFSGLRMFPVKRFDKYLIFYQATEEELLIIRVLHGARDIVALFEEETDK